MIGGPRLPWDQRAARRLVRPLAAAGIPADAVTMASALLAILAATLFARGEAGAANWAAGLFVVARFLDHVDGELARATGSAGDFGRHFDAIVGAVSYAALFVGIGVGLSGGDWGLWPGLAGAGIGAFVGVNMILRIRMTVGGEAPGYPGAGGFELEDGIYLIAPVTWLGGLGPFFALACLGTAIFCACTVVRYLRGTGSRRKAR